MLVRAGSLEQSMSYYLIQQIPDIDQITVRTCTEVAEVQGDGHLERLELRDLNTGSLETVDAVSCSYSSERRRGPAGSTAWWPATSAGSSLPGST